MLLIPTCHPRLRRNRPRSLGQIAPGRNRRLSKDYEYIVQTSEIMIDIAAIRIMLNQLAPA